ncbi:uncharacterized protein LOC108598970 isoform X2 [Drosophila busckii]|uniref:uncharacterized protein LOC108598970 isoform X2 n=1 Tax=Drosophila busckii TaxID=30019 RepID=UPI001432C804|nr:uncharacterized protein LOC108598970 isoform X2 [Drosophila busckii]
MSRNSDKLNIIDQNTFQNIKNDSSDNLPRILRSSKYKNKHKKQQPCTLLDFVVVPCKKPKQIKRQKAPHLIAARCTVSFKFKHKGKVRLHAKRRVTRLKRIISKHRKWKQSAAERGSVLENEIQDEPIEQEGTCSDFELCIGGTEDNIQPDMLQLTTDLGQMSFNKEESRQPMHAIHSRRFRSNAKAAEHSIVKRLASIPKTRLF